MDCSKYLGSQAAADGGCDRDVVHRMNEGYRAWGSVEKCANNRILDKCEEVSKWTNCVVQSRGMG